MSPVVQCLGFGILTALVWAQFPVREAFLLPLSLPPTNLPKATTEPDMEQQTGSKLAKEYIKTVYCHSAR